MKRLHLYYLLAAVVISVFLTGCYTQVGMGSAGNGWDTGYAQNNENQEYTDSYEESYPDSEYYDDSTTIINNYYYGGYPYHRYYSYYYPSFSIGFNFGYYDPYYPCYDPWWGWCGTGVYWYWPYYYPYYSYYTYYPYYYGGYPYYYGHPYYYADQHNNGYYKERSQDIYRNRNTTGLRGTRYGTVRDNNGNDRTNLSKERQREIRSGNSRIINSDINRDRISAKSKEMQDAIRNRTNQNDRKVTSKENNDRKVLKTTPNNQRHTRVSGTKEGKTTGSNTYGRQRSGNTQKSYSPPRNSNPTRSYNPPRNNTSSPRSTGSSNRSTGRSNSSSGRRR